jgi:hypothetical protein
MKRQRAQTERIIAKYMKITEPKLVSGEYDFATCLLPDYPAPILEGIRLVLENFGKEYPDAPRPEGVRRRLLHSIASSRSDLPKD